MEYILDTKLKDLVSKKHEYTLKMRRHFHAHPEIGLHEYETCKTIRKELDETGIKWIEASKTGTIGIIEGNKDSDNILVLRADIDALRINELVECDYKSQNQGLMHACGHDGHAATLLSAAKILKEEYEGKFDGIIYLLFQPGEEASFGAKEVIKTGLLNKAKAFYGQHIWTYLDIGKVATRKGPLMFGMRTFSINVKGQGGHGSGLEKTKNPIVPASSIVLALQTIVSNNISALQTGVVCVGGINGGNQSNTVCEECNIIGSTRYMSKEIDGKLCKRIEEIVVNTAKAYECEASVEFGGSISILNTDDKLTDIANGVYSKVVGKENVIEWGHELISEDFAEYIDIAPGSFGFIGCRNESIGADKTHHSAYFKIDEDCLDIAVATYVQFAKDYYGILD